VPVVDFAAAPLPPPPRHDGFYLRFSSGGGYVSVAGDGPLGSASISGFGSSSLVAIGGTIAPGLALAGTIASTTTTDTFHGGPFNDANQASLVTSVRRPTSPSFDALAAVTEIGLLADWFPDPARGWHLGALVALGAVGVVNQADGSSWGGFNASGSVFGGHDWWIGRSWSLGLMLSVAGGSRASLSDSSGNDTGYKLAPLSIALESSLLYY
jgi:hypothetical protein